MEKPKNKTELIAYLAAHPMLEWSHPRGVVAPRKFLRATSRDIVFQTGGREAYLPIVGGKFSFSDVGVRVDVETTGLSIHYRYIDEPAPTPS